MKNRIKIRIQVILHEMLPKQKMLNYLTLSILHLMGSEILKFECTNQKPLILNYVFLSLILKPEKINTTCLSELIHKHFEKHIEKEAEFIKRLI